MSLRQRLLDVPGVAGVRSRFDAWRFRILESQAQAALRASSHPTAKPLLASLESLRKPLPVADRSRIEAIESERQRLLQCQDLLDDGSLGAGANSDLDCRVCDACKASKPPVAALWLYWLVRHTGARRILEMGTNLGISSAYLGSALEMNGGHGKLLTLDLSPYRQRVARRVHENLQLQARIDYRQGLFRDSLAPALAEFEELDLIFVDGHHHYEPTLHYLAQILPRVNLRTVLVFDDIRWSAGMRRAWRTIREEPRIGFSLDLHSVGVACLQDEAGGGQPLPGRIRLF